MGLEPERPKNESGYYQLVRGLTFGDIFWERVEPANESGFPDTHFVIRDGSGEGTVEFKYERNKTKLNLPGLLRGNQKSSMIEYFEAGGRRRFALCYWQGYSYLYDSEAYYNTILGRPAGPLKFFMDDQLVIGEWLKACLRKNNDS